jgi:4-aminobutyrate aminotransferase-like enzyme/Ser/Thr protein kinase RdoA (MazF antagonist)
MTVSEQNRPDMPCDLVREAVRDLYGLDGGLEPLPAEWDQNLALDTSAGRYVVKIANRGHRDDVIDLQNAALDRLSERWSAGITPAVVRSKTGQPVSQLHDGEGKSWRLRILTWLDGDPLSGAAGLDLRSLGRIGETLAQMDRVLESFAHPGMNRDLIWDLRNAQWISADTRRVDGDGRRMVVDRILLQYRGRIVPLLGNLPQTVIHGDANDENILLEPAADGGHRVSGLLDFGDMSRSYTVGELAIAGAYAILGREEPLEALAALARGYARARPLSELELHVLFPLVLMRLCVSVTNSAIAAESDPGNKHRLASDTPAWDMLERLAGVRWPDAECRLRKACGYPDTVTDSGPPARGSENLLAKRKSRIGPSLSLAYDEPVEIVRGSGQFLYDSSGRAWLDCVNNVPHVGHCHPAVVEAMSNQAAVLNTNTRYLHRLLVEYAGRLSATMPDPLEVCYFVNSGSEANELALRLARTHTGRRDVIVLEGGYHGNTSSLVDLSPYKCEGPGGRGLAPWAHKVPVPDPYRGRFRGRGRGTGRAYAGQVGELCDRLADAGTPPAMFLCEPILGCGGQVVLPDGYLESAFEAVRSAGGLCVVDEVQVGMGRVGSHWWAFETQGVVPDIVTIGKPIGNGFPLGAVVTTHEIADSFDNGMEYFNTFGGNQVSIAAGMAVMDVVEREGLRGRAERVGKYLRDGFARLAGRHSAIGDIRGLGMFMGVELVRDRDTLEPATKETATVIERVKDDGILLSAEGPFHNVLKIKPPLQFVETDADLLLNSVDRALGEVLPGR